VRAHALCQRLGGFLASFLAEPSVKEITLTARGVRIVRQVAEGRRGEHLLLRQAVFDLSQVERSVFVQTLRDAAALAAQRTAAVEERAA
jgi:hypothetical protein